MRCGSLAVEDGSIAGGKVVDAAAAGQAIRQMLARTEITETRALIAASDVVATFRTMHLPGGTTDHEVDSAVAKELSLETGRILRQWINVVHSAERRVVYAVAWDRDLVKGLTDAARHAGLEVSAVDLKSVCLARTAMEPSCVIVDLVASPVEIVLVDQHLPQLWHSVELSADMNDDLASTLAAPLRATLRFHMRGRRGAAPAQLPVLISSEHTIAAHVLAELGELVEQPVSLMPPPPRVAGHVRHSTYLTCIGLMMRRSR